MTLFNWLTEFVCGIGIVTGLTWLLNKKWWFSGANHLALYLILFCLVFLEQNLYWRPFFLDYPHFVLITDPLALMLGPLLFLFNRGRGKGGFQVKWILHFIPAFIIILFYLPVYLLSTSDKVQFIIDTIWHGSQINSASFILFRVMLVCQIAGYGYFLQVKNNYSWKPDILLSQRISLEQLLLSSYFLYGILRVIWLGFTIAIPYTYVPYVDSALRFFTTLTILYLFIHVVSKIKFSNTGSSYINSLLDENEVIQLKGRLSTLMTSSQPYLRQDLKMIEIASDLKISEHKLSQLLNVHLGINFFEYVNEYRIRKARQLLRDPEYAKYTIEAIAKECGFNSKSTFNQAFRKMAGVTPSGFKNQNEDVD